MPQPEMPRDAAGMETLLRSRRLGPPQPGDVTPWDFAFRWGPTAVHSHVWPVVSRLLTDADDVVRFRAVELIRNWPDGVSVSGPRLLEVAEQDLALFKGQTSEGCSLSHELTVALAVVATPANRERILAVLRRLAQDGPLAGAAGPLFALSDPEFVIAQAEKWGAGAAPWCLDAAPTLGLYHRDRVPAFLEAAKGLDAAKREQLVGLVDQAMQRDDAAAARMAASEGVEPPRQAAPTSAELRRAAGLE